MNKSAGRDAALALSRYAAQEGFYVGQPKQALAPQSTGDFL